MAIYEDDLGLKHDLRAAYPKAGYDEPSTAAVDEHMNLVSQVKALMQEVRRLRQENARSNELRYSEQQKRHADDAALAKEIAMLLNTPNEQVNGRY